MTDYKVLENNTGVTGVVIAEKDNHFYIFEDEEKFEQDKNLRQYETLAEAHAFLNGIYYTCMKSLFSGRR